MPKVGIVMGSDSDLKVMSKAADMLDKLGIEYDMKQKQTKVNPTTPENRTCTDRQKKPE